MIFAIDFDGTLCEDRFPEIGEPREDMIRAVLAAQRTGDRSILWTCRIGERLEEAVAWSAAQGIIFDAVNDNLPDMIAKYGTTTRGGDMIAAAKLWKTPWTPIARACTFEKLGEVSAK